VKRARWVALIVAGALLGTMAWRTLREPASSPTGPNVLFVVWDTTRADRMSLYGYGRPTTPKLEAWARDAVVFERATSPAIWTLPSHASLFTGLPSPATGADERWLWLDHRHLTMAEHFAAHGYDTFSFAANTLLNEDTNLVQGFRVRLNSYRGKIAQMAKARTREKILPGDRSNELAPGWTRPEHGARNAEWNRAVFKEAAPIGVDAFLEWLDRRPTADQPFFAFLNLMEAHTPRLPSTAAREQVVGDDPDLIARGLATDAAHIRLHFYNFGKQDYTQAELDAIGAVYDATLAELDAETDRLLAGLSSKGLLDDTIVVLTADHGENLGDHHLFNHRFALWETLLHVPLVVRHPSLPPRRVSRPVSTLDLFATLSRVAGLPVPAGIAAGDLLADRSSPAVATMALPVRREIETVQRVHPDVAIEPWLRTGEAVVDGTTKLVRYSDGARTVYDLATDPGETTAIDDAARAAELGRTIDAWLGSFPAYDPALRGPKDRPSNVKAQQRELREELEALGYVTDE
jgi:arylsulfatase A-like enzyme